MQSKKQLKQDYKQLKPIMAVFQIKNKRNGKILIESSTDVMSKWNRHQTELRFGSHRNKELQKDWNSVTSEDFEFSILSELEHKAQKSVNYKEELEVLQDMILEELNIKEGILY